MRHRNVFLITARLNYNRTLLNGCGQICTEPMNLLMYG